VKSSYVWRFTTADERKPGGVTLASHSSVWRIQVTDYPTLDPYARRMKEKLEMRVVH